MIIGFLSPQHVFHAFSPLAVEYEFRKKMGSGDYLSAALPDGDQHKVEEQLDKFWQQRDIGIWARQFCAIRNALDYNILLQPLDAAVLNQVTRNAVAFAGADLDHAKTNFGRFIEQVRVTWQSMYSSSYYLEQISSVPLTATLIKVLKDKYHRESSK